MDAQKQQKQQAKKKGTAPNTASSQAATPTEPLQIIIPSQDDDVTEVEEFGVSNVFVSELS